MSIACYVVAVHARIGDTQVDIDLNADGDVLPVRHLMLTGRNGSGKTRTLGRIVTALTNYHGSDAPLDDPNRGGVQLRRIASHVSGYSCVYLSDHRRLAFDSVENVQRESYLNAPSRLHQYLVDLRVSSSMYRDEGDLEQADACVRRIEAVQSAIGVLMEEPSLRLVFQVARRNFEILVNGSRVPFDSISAGFRNAIELWSSIESARQRDVVRGRDEFRGVVAIDEVENHLHPSLQQTILPFLTKSFPYAQFLVATHSPIVASSLASAVVHDVATNRSSSGTEFQGVPYGVTMRSFFHARSDIDSETTGELNRLRRLLDEGGSENDEPVASLISRLNVRSAYVRMLVYTMLERWDAKQ